APRGRPGARVELEGPRHGRRQGQAGGRPDHRGLPLARLRARRDERHGRAHPLARDRGLRDREARRGRPVDPAAHPLGRVRGGHQHADPRQDRRPRRLPHPARRRRGAGPLPHLAGHRARGRDRAPRERCHAYGRAARRVSRRAGGRRRGVTRPAVPVALVVAASLLGDTFLYTVLPVSAARLGVTPLMVGLLLSVNRWIRLFTNPLAARLYGRWPAGWLVMTATVLAAFSTALYLEPGWILVFLAARCVWGFAFSLLRLGSIVSAVDEAGPRAGRRLGETRAIWGVGYLAGAVYAPLAVEAVGWPLAVLGAAALTLVGGIGPAVVAFSWRRAISAVQVGDLRLS